MAWPPAASTCCAKRYALECGRRVGRGAEQARRRHTQRGAGVGAAARLNDGASRGRLKKHPLQQRIPSQSSAAPLKAWARDRGRERAQILRARGAEHGGRRAWARTGARSDVSLTSPAEPATARSPSHEAAGRRRGKRRGHKMRRQRRFRKFGQVQGSHDRPWRGCFSHTLCSRK